jgi:hypothetical protein
MKRRTSTLPCRVYTYGCFRSPTANAAEVDKQIYLARMYRNKLLEIELARRAKYREVTGEHEDLSPILLEMTELDARLEELRAHINSARADARKRVQLKTASDQAKLIRLRLRELRARVKEVRKALQDDPIMAAQVIATDKEAKDAIKAARATCGVYWGTYLLVEAQVEQAAKSKTDPRFGRWDGTGRIGVQIQGGASVDDITSGRCSLLQIDPLPDDQWESRSGRRGAKTIVRFRIGSDEKRGPIWAEFSVLMHRPLPDDAVIKSAVIIRRRRPSKDRFGLQIVLESALVERAKMPESAPVAAINFGWRVRPDGLRVAMLVDEMGRTREMILPATILARLDHADSLCAIRDRSLESFRPQLVAALAKLEADGNLPEWLAEERKTMSAWRACARFNRLVIRWIHNRFDGDEAAFEEADIWRRSNLHLHIWEEAERSRAMAHRREVYRGFAAEMSRTYSLLVIEKFDLRDVAKRAKPEEEDESIAAVRKHRQRASISALRMCLMQGSRIARMDSANTTHECNECGSIEDFDAAVHLEHACSQCGSVWDQDVNASKILLRRYRDRPTEPTESIGLDEELGGDL